MIPFFILVLLTGVQAATTNATNLFEKTFARDNTFCHNKTARIEILIRGETKYSEIHERGFGEFLFVNHPKKKILSLELNNSRSDSFRFFPGVSPMCSKGLGFKMDSKIALLLLKENRPFKEKLVIQFFDYDTLMPKEYIETNYVTSKAKKFNDGFAFNVLGERYESDMGKVKIEGVQYIYQDRDFPKWMSYSAKGFEILPSLTYEMWPWKKAFKDEADFLAMTGWDPVEKVFKNNISYIAVNHSIKKGCMLFVNAKKKVDGSESWRCQTM